MTNKAQTEKATIEAHIKELRKQQAQAASPDGIELLIRGLNQRLKEINSYGR